MATLAKLKVGQRLWTVTRSRLGNTTLRTVNVHGLVVREVNEADGYVVASWNGNEAKRYYRGDIASWKVSEPVTVKGFFGSKRLARKDEKAQILAKRHDGDER